MEISKSTARCNKTKFIGIGLRNFIIQRFQNLELVFNRILFVFSQGNQRLSSQADVFIGHEQVVKHKV